MTNIITFTDIIGISEEYSPIPASKLIPDWYKNLEPYRNKIKSTDGNANTTATAKRCMPIYDVMNSGYIISTHCDLLISQVADENGSKNPYYEWTNFGAISFHPKGQLPEHPGDTGHKIAYPRWKNAWAIKTPIGYSTLFVSPFHRETPIIIFPAIVDTDKYNAQVNFPFVLKNPTMEGLIPAGTPLAQVIPFKRDSWEMKIGSQEEMAEYDKTVKKLKSLAFNSYKRQFRQPKEYR